MPQNVAESLREDRLLRSEGPHAPATGAVEPATLHRCLGIEGPFASPALRPALRLAVQASVRPRHRKRRRAVTRDMLHPLLATCASDRLAYARDVAILIVAFPSGGRRCSEAAGLRVGQLREEPSVQKHRTPVGSIEA